MNRVLQPNEDRKKVIREIEWFLSTLPADKPYLIDITKLVKKRSNLQNKALWGVAYKVICDATGYKDQDLHVLLCGEYFGWGVIDLFGNKKKVPIRTTTHNDRGERDVISTEELASYYQFIQVFAANYSVDVPDPDPKWNLKPQGAPNAE